MLKPFLSFTLMCIASISIPGLSASGMTPSKSVETSDKTYYEDGLKFLEKKQYIKARLAFQLLINSYAESNLAAPAYFALADSYYEEGGAENQLLAQEQFGNFIIFFPQHPKVPEARMKIISSKMKSIEAGDRDRAYTIRAEQEMKSFLERYPDSEYAPNVKQWLKRVQDILRKTEQPGG